MFLTKVKRRISSKLYKTGISEYARIIANKDSSFPKVHFPETDPQHDFMLMLEDLSFAYNKQKLSERLWKSISIYHSYKDQLYESIKLSFNEKGRRKTEYHFYGISIYIIDSKNNNDQLLDNKETWGFGYKMPWKWFEDQLKIITINLI